MSPLGAATLTASNYYPARFDPGGTGLLVSLTDPRGKVGVLGLNPFLMGLTPTAANGK
ncbi:MAG: hypothetical protein ACRDGH_01710 [Candidatus Limnocylindria bacterium]